MKDESNVPPKPTRAGKDGGGQLKTGNTKGVGRLRKDVKTKHVRNASKATADLRKIIEWKACIPVPGAIDEDGNQLFRCPTFDEWKWAVEQSNRYGTGTQVDLSADEDFALKVVYTFE